MAMPAEFASLVHPVFSSSAQLSSHALSWGCLRTHFVAHDQDIVNENCRLKNGPSPAKGSVSRLCCSLSSDHALRVSGCLAQSAMLNVDRQRPLGPYLFVRPWSAVPQAPLCGTSHPLGFSGSSSTLYSASSSSAGGRQSMPNQLAITGQAFSQLNSEPSTILNLSPAVRSFRTRNS